MVDRDTWDAKVDTIVDRLVPVAIRQVRPAAERQFSRRAYERNDWTPREKVTWDAAFTLDGKPFFGWDEVGRGYPKRGDALADAQDHREAVRSALHEDYWNYLDGRLEADYVALVLAG